MFDRVPLMSLMTLLYEKSPCITYKSYYLNCPRKDPQCFGQENSRGENGEREGEAKKLGGGGWGWKAQLPRWRKVRKIL